MQQSKFALTSTHLFLFYTIPNSVVMLQSKVYFATVTYPQMCLIYGTSKVCIKFRYIGCQKCPIICQNKSCTLYQLVMRHGIELPFLYYLEHISSFFYMLPLFHERTTLPVRRLSAYNQLYIFKDKKLFRQLKVFYAFCYAMYAIT